MTGTLAPTSYSSIVKDGRENSGWESHTTVTNRIPVLDWPVSMVDVLVPQPQTLAHTLSPCWPGQCMKQLVDIPFSTVVCHWTGNLHFPRRSRTAKWINEKYTLYLCVCLMIRFCGFLCHVDASELGFGAKFPSSSGLPGSQPGGTISEQNHSIYECPLLNIQPRISRLTLFLTQKQP